MAAGWPPTAAACSGVHPFSFLALTFAPSASSTLMATTCMTFVCRHAQRRVFSLLTGVEC